MTRSDSALVLVMCFALLSGCSNEESAPTDSEPEPSKPKAATATAPPSEVLKKFYRSLAESYYDDAISCTTGDALSREFVESQVRLNIAFQLLGKNSVEHFGDEGKALQKPPPALAPLQEVDRVAVNVSGSTATWPLNPNNPMKLVLIDGEWKFDLAGSFPSPAALRSANRTFDAVAAYISDVANGIAAGEFNTIPEVRQEIKRRGQVVGR